VNVVSFGGGVNSTAVIVGMYERGERIDAIVFADTGVEKPHTYDFINQLSEWCVSNSLPYIEIVKGSQPQQVIDGTLENECLRLGALPSKAMGFGACSMKWKQDPFKKWVKKNCAERPTVMYGFDAGEFDRVERSQKYIEDLYDKRYPLVEWDWHREECVAAILRHGLPDPGKSACFFCPSSKKPEIIELKRRYPDLLNRALEIERKALAGEGPAPAFRGKGLGRSFSWGEFLRLTEAQQDLFSDAGTPEVDCGCYDG